jgi:hypothetical protein
MRHLRESRQCHNAVQIAKLAAIKMLASFVRIASTRY